MEQGRKTWLISVVMLILLLLTFLFAGEVVFAAHKKSGHRKKSSGSKELSTLKKMPYVENGHTLVLRFKDFSIRGYTYKITNSKTKKKITGKLKPKKEYLAVNLKKRRIYSPNTCYVMELYTKNKRKKVTTRFFTGKAFADMVVNQNADKGITCSWKLRNNTTYTGLFAAVSKTENAIWSSTYGFGNNGNVQFRASKMNAGKWFLTGIAYRSIRGLRYYGERVTKLINYDSNAVKVSAFTNKTVNPNAPEDVRKIVPVFNMDNELCLKWKEVDEADLYKVYYRKTGEPAFRFLGKTKKETFNLEELDKNTSYDLIVYSVAKKKGVRYRSPNGSNIITMTPEEYIKANRQYLLASKVRTIGYHRGGCDYTTRKYDKETKVAYVNYKKFTSKTKYLIWVSHYTQQASIYKKKAGKWKIIRSFTVGTGRSYSRSPRGIFKISRKESGWYYTNTMELYVSHYAGRNAFHTRPLYRGGGVATSTIGRPCSHGCVRCYNEDAKFIYKKVPVGTTVVSY